MERWERPERVRTGDGISPRVGRSSDAIRATYGPVYSPLCTPRQAGSVGLWLVTVWICA